MTLRCRLGRHRLPVTLVGMTEQSEKRGMRTLAGFRCRCGTLVFTQFTDWREGRGARRGLKREAVRT